MNFVNLTDPVHIDCVLVGAAITIQTAWRKYVKTLAASCVRNNAPDADVILFVQNQIFYCHSILLCSHSQVFKNLINNYKTLEHDLDKNGADHCGKACGGFRYKFELFIHPALWEIIQNYLYGHQVKLEPNVSKELLNIAEKFQINELVDQLARFNEPKYLFEYISDTEEKNGESEQPYQLTSSYYSFFKCVIEMYCDKLLTTDEINVYLSAKFIAYSQMSPKQLLKCLSLLKSKLDIKDAQFLLGLILKEYEHKTLYSGELN